MKQLQEKLLALLLMALLSGTGAYAQEAPDKQKTPDKVVIFRYPNLDIILTLYCK